MKRAIYIFLIACGGQAEPQPQETSPGNNPLGTALEQGANSTSRAPDAGDEARASSDAWACQPCCLNQSQHNCLGGNASMTGECTDPGAPAVCNAETHECVGLQCNF